MIQVGELTGYWRGNPPVHVLLRAFMGMESGKRTSGTKPHQPDEAELKALAAMFRQ